MHHHELLFNLAWHRVEWTVSPLTGSQLLCVVFHGTITYLVDLPTWQPTWQRHFGEVLLEPSTKEVAAEVGGMAASSATGNSIYEVPVSFPIPIVVNKSESEVTIWKKTCKCKQKKWTYLHYWGWKSCQFRFFAHGTRGRGFGGGACGVAGGTLIWPWRCFLRTFPLQVQGFFCCCWSLGCTWLWDAFQGLKAEHSADSSLQFVIHALGLLQGSAVRLH